MPAETFAEKLIAEHLPTPEQRAQAAKELFDQWAREDYTDDPEEIARRNREFEEFKAAMNANRLESEGPNARTPFP